MLFSVTTILIVLALGESALRLAGVNARVDNPFFLLVHVFEYPDYFEKDEQLFWRLRRDLSSNIDFIVPGFYRTNSLGLRGAEPPWDSLDRHQVVATFGNSNTFGWGVDENQSYSEMLNHHLNDQVDTGGFYVFNCGVPGYSTYQGLKLMRRYLPKIKPDYVTILYGWNDHWAGAFDLADKDQKMARQYLLDIQNQLSKSYLYRAVKWLLLSRSERAREDTYSRAAPVYRVSKNDYRANLIEIVNLCRSSGATPILITAPKGKTGSRLAGMSQFHEDYNSIVRSVAAEFNVPLVDAVRLFERFRAAFDSEKDWIHFTPQGARLIATHLAKIILQHERARISADHR